MIKLKSIARIAAFDPSRQFFFRVTKTFSFSDMKFPETLKRIVLAVVTQGNRFNSLVQNRQRAHGTQPLSRKALAATYGQSFA